MGCVPSNNPRESNNHPITEELTRYSLLLHHPSPDSIAARLLERVAEANNNQSVSRVKLLYRASEHSFDAAAFHRACHECKNTLLIAYSSNKCLFGAYTPAVWKKGVKYTYEQDPTHQSFLWSSRRPHHEDLIQEIEIMPLRKEGGQKAIQNDMEAGPIFGAGHDLFICDRANKEESSSNLGISYQIPHRYQSLKGNPLTKSTPFTLSEYEVWEIGLC